MSKYLYRVSTSGGSLSNPRWSRKNAEDHAKFALRIGAKEACVERARSYSGGRSRGEFDQVVCFRAAKR